MKKLTHKQNEVVWCLQNGGVLVTDSGVKGAWVAFDKWSKYDSFHIHNGVFFNLVDKGIIYQRLNRPFDYILTKEGETLKTTKPKHY